MDKERASTDRSPFDNRSTVHVECRAAIARADLARMCCINREKQVQREQEGAHGVCNGTPQSVPYDASHTQSIFFHRSGRGTSLFLLRSVCCCVRACSSPFEPAGVPRPSVRAGCFLAGFCDHTVCKSKPHTVRIRSLLKPLSLCCCCKQQDYQHSRKRRSKETPATLKPVHKLVDHSRPQRLDSPKRLSFSRPTPSRALDSSVGLSCHIRSKAG